MSTHERGGSDFFTMCNALTDELTRRCQVALVGAGHAGIRPGYWPVLHHLSAKAYVTVELAPLLGITNQGVSKMATELMDLGLVGQGADESDRRLRPLHLTDTGRDALAVLVHTEQQLTAELTAATDEPSLTSTLAVLRKFSTVPAIAAFAPSIRPLRELRAAPV